MSPDDSDGRSWPLSDADYRAIASFRAALRRFLHFSEEAARAAKISPQQHQLLLAIRGFEGAGAPAIGDLAEALQIRHHSCVGLVDRLEQHGFVRRVTGAEDARMVFVEISPPGKELLAGLTSAHRHEHGQLHAILDELARASTESDSSGPDSSIDQ